MKKRLALSTILFAGAFLAACSSSSSSADAEDSSSSGISSSSSEAFDCTLEEEGVKILLPAGGEAFSIGDSIEIRFVANYKNAGGFRVLYKASAEDSGTDLFENSIGDDAPDGTECTAVKALLGEDLTASDEAFLRVQAYNAGKIRADSETFSVKE